MAAHYLLQIINVLFCLTSVGSVATAKRRIATHSSPPIASPPSLPWTSSLNPDRSLTYMPMLDAQLRLMRSMGMEQVELEERLVYRGSEVKPARIGNMLFRSAQFRKVRLTYFDGGDAVQVFNTLWYPSYEYDAPMLGVDLISLGLSRVLNVIDFQPLHPTPEYSAKHIDHLASIRSKYPELHGTLSGKIYDDTSFFSKQMLFGRFTDESKVAPVVQPAFEDYLSAYIETVGRCVPDTRQESMAEVKLRQKAYDIYSAQKDPAVGLFDAYFGKDWSHDFVHDFLFSLCESNSGKSLTEPVHKFQINSAGQVGIGNQQDGTLKSQKLAY